MSRICDTCKFRKKTLVFPLTREFDKCSSPQATYKFCDVMTKTPMSFNLVGDCNGGLFYQPDDRKWYQFWKNWTF
jgi:hypothetical protein